MAGLKDGGGMGLPASSLGQEFFDGCLEARQLFVHRLPNDVEIGDEVLMCEDVTHSREPTPVDGGMALRQILRKLLDGLADDFEVVEDRIARTQVGIEC